MPTWCDQAYFSKEQLMMIVTDIKGEMSGSQPKKCQCPVCGKSFSRTYDLLIHSNSHTGDKPYQCNICDSAFSTKSNLLRLNYFNAMFVIELF